MKNRKVIYTYNPKLHSFFLPEYERAYSMCDGEVGEIVQTQKILNGETLFTLSFDCFMWPHQIHVYGSEIKEVQE